MEGVSSEDNEIYLELIPENLGKALKAAQNARSLKIKLTKKHAPCLTLEIELVQTCLLIKTIIFKINIVNIYIIIISFQPSLTHRPRVVVHDVPVTVIPRRMWRDYSEPTMPHFDVSLHLYDVFI